MMTVRRQSDHGFNTATIVQVLAIPILTVAFYAVGNYFITGNKLAEHDTAIKSLVETEKHDKEEDAKVRERTRNEFLGYQQKTTEILGKLDTRLAVSETKQETANQTLQKIADELSKMNAGVRSVR